MNRTKLLSACLAMLLPAAAFAAKAAAPASDATCYAAAIALDKAGKKSEAAQQLRQALRIKPASVPYLNMLGSLCYDLGKYPEAVKNLEAAQELEPKKVWHYYLAKSLLKTGRLEEARKAAATASRLEPQKGRQLEMIKLGETIKAYRASFEAAKAAWAGENYVTAAAQLRKARVLIDTEEARKLDGEINNATAAGDLSWLITRARQALDKRDLAAARGAFNAARQLSDNAETKSLGALLEKAEAFRKHMTQADTQLNYRKFIEARDEASQALALFPGGEAKAKLEEIDKAEQNDRYQLHFDQARAFLKKDADYASALGELKLAMEISATDEAKQLLADIDKMKAGQSYKEHYNRAAQLLRLKNYDGALAELNAAAAVVKTDDVEALIAQATKQRDRTARGRLMFWAATALAMLTMIFGGVRMFYSRHKANASLTALANMVEAIRLSDFRKAMAEYENFKAAGGRAEDIPADELIAVFSSAGVLGKLADEKVSAGYLLECALHLVQEGKSAEAFMILGGSSLLKKIELIPDFEAFVNVYGKAGKLDALEAMVETGGFAPETYTGLAAAMLDLQHNELGVRILQAKRKFHELQKADSDLLFAFTSKR
ncbi:MAG: tetratricopeptide repeat protein [Elusimicrobiota bacterium]